MKFGYVRNIVYTNVVKKPLKSPLQNDFLAEKPCLCFFNVASHV